MYFRLFHYISVVTITHPTGAASSRTLRDSCPFVRRSARPRNSPTSLSESLGAKVFAVHILSWCFPVSLSIYEGVVVITPPKKKHERLEEQHPFQCIQRESPLLYWYWPILYCTGTVSYKYWSLLSISCVIPTIQVPPLQLRPQTPHLWRQDTRPWLVLPLCHSHWHAPPWR